jgi:hypothetical protein
MAEHDEEDDSALSSDTDSDASDLSDPDCDDRGRVATLFRVFVGDNTMHKIVITIYIRDVYHLVKIVHGTATQRRAAVDYILYGVDGLRDLPHALRDAIACPASTRCIGAKVRHGNWTVMSAFICHD